ncbi:hypothetical protein [Thioclava sp. GXIMD4216]|uniref:Secreted protein n=1 Tax=Thioclava litoralis TaxID=3076557 RepID=A0ABZ1E213_9RHOB|nr:hypothetical protein RPE78_01470 [Thioclava sp. FTW29]
MITRCPFKVILLGAALMGVASCRPGFLPFGTPGAAQTLPPVGKARDSLLQQSCTKRGGTWNQRADGAICVTRPKDAGKSCRKASDCEGECLARSNTCAPVRPLMGCNDIRTENGMSVTQCLG